MTESWFIKGCEKCRGGVMAGKWRPPYLVATSSVLHARLHLCTACGAYWEEGEREAHIIGEQELHQSWGRELSQLETELAPVRKYLGSGKPRVCRLDVSPYGCEFWSEQELRALHLEYEFPRYAPGYFGFATNGGGELYAVSKGAVWYLPAIGMSTDSARILASSWAAFERMLGSEA